MTKDVIELAREAGFFLYDLTETHGIKTVESDAADQWAQLAHFAALVAARERERCANHIEDCEPPIAVHGARVEIGITTRIAYANSIRALNTEGEGNDPITG